MDITTPAGQKAIQLNGVNDTLRAFRRLGIDTTELKALNFEAGVIVAKKVRTPVESGRLAMTLRVARGTGQAKVSLGNRLAWWAPFVNYGTRLQDSQALIWEAREKSLDELKLHYEDGLDRIITKHGLEGN